MTVAERSGAMGELLMYASIEGVKQHPDGTVSMVARHESTKEVILVERARSFDDVVDQMLQRVWLVEHRLDQEASMLDDAEINRLIALELADEYDGEWEAGYRAGSYDASREVATAAAAEPLVVNGVKVGDLIAVAFIRIEGGEAESE